MIVAVFGCYLNDITRSVGAQVFVDGNDTKYKHYSAHLEGHSCFVC